MNGAPVRFGPTAASKTLYALRPQVFVPWDAPERSSLGYDGSGESYSRYLKRVRDDLRQLAGDCEERGMRLTDLPGILDCPDRTLVDLLNQYNWVTLTRQVTPPSEEQLKQWYEWSRKELPLSGLAPGNEI